MIATHRLTVARTARYAVTGAEPEAAARLWIAFHGYGHRAADFLAPFDEIKPADTRVVAPEGLSRFYLESPRPDGGHLLRTGASWLTRDDRDDDLRDTLAMVQAVTAREHAAIVAARGTPPLLGVLGFSQGVAMSMRLAVDAAANPSLGRNARVHAHVLWAGGLAHDITDEALRSAWSGTAVHLVMGDRDRFGTDESRAAVRQRLDAIGCAYTEHAFAGGHRLDGEVLARVLAMPMSSAV